MRLSEQLSQVRSDLIKTQEELTEAKDQHIKELCRLIEGNNKAVADIKADHKAQVKDLTDKLQTAHMRAWEASDLRGQVRVLKAILVKQGLLDDDEA